MTKSQTLLKELHSELGGGELAKAKLKEYTEAVIEEWEERETNYIIETMPYDTPIDKYSTTEERKQQFTAKLFEKEEADGRL